MSAAFCCLSPWLFLGHVSAWWWLFSLNKINTVPVISSQSFSLSMTIDLPKQIFFFFLTKQSTCSNCKWKISLHRSWPGNHQTEQWATWQRVTNSFLSGYKSNSCQTKTLFCFCNGLTVFCAFHEIHLKRGAALARIHDTAALSAAVIESHSSGYTTSK